MFLVAELTKETVADTPGNEEQSEMEEAAQAIPQDIFLAEFERRRLADAVANMDVEGMKGNKIILAKYLFHSHNYALNSPAHTSLWNVDGSYNYQEKYVDYFSNLSP